MPNLIKKKILAFSYFQEMIYYVVSLWREFFFYKLYIISFYEEPGTLWLNSKKLPTVRDNIQEKARNGGLGR